MTQGNKTIFTTKNILYVTAFMLSAIHISNIWMIYSPNILRGLHLGLLFPLIYLKGIDQKKKLNIVLDLTKMFIGLFACLYYGFTFDTLVERVTTPTAFDQLIGTLFILIMIDATIRTVGLGMGVVTAVFLVYVFIGKYLPGALGHAGYSFSRVLGHLYISSNGVFGSLLQISATYIAMFTILGAFLSKSGASDAFIKIAIKATGRMQGGPALAAVVASSLFGMVNGSAVVNVITTGTFTIPLMKSIGIAPYVAGAVEAAASTGGQLMPPVMGAGAFIMSEITGVPYSEIIIKAFIPALVYFIGVYLGVYCYVKRENIPTIEKSRIPSKKEVLSGIYLLIPLFIVAVLVLSRFSPMYAAAFGVLSAAVIIIGRNLSKAKEMMKILGASLVDGGTQMTSVAMGLACAGIIIGVVTLTGLGTKFVTLVLELSNGIPLLALVFVAAACLVLGMGLPTSAAYVITATMAVPAMVEMGYPLFASHLFVFYFGVIAPITPPVAIAAYAGAGIAGASPNKTGLKAFIFALPAFLMPFMFVSNPVLLSEGGFIAIVWSMFTAVLGTMGLAAATQGYFFTKINLPVRFILGIAALCLIDPGAITDIIGLVTMIVLFIGLLIRKRIQTVAQ